MKILKLTTKGNWSPMHIMYSDRLKKTYNFMKSVFNVKKKKNITEALSPED